MARERDISALSEEEYEILLRKILGRFNTPVLKRTLVKEKVLRKYYRLTKGGIAPCRHARAPRGGAGGGATGARPLNCLKGPQAFHLKFIFLIKTRFPHTYITLKSISGGLHFKRSRPFHSPALYIFETM